tara:strand:- start:660 stop:920 length:261 start_codon:yes stop_codon:yes gene_type:complete
LIASGALQLQLRLRLRLRLRLPFQLHPPRRARVLTMRIARRHDAYAASIADKRSRRVKSSGFGSIFHAKAPVLAPFSATIRHMGKV